MLLNIINQLRFARMEFRRGFEGVNDEEGFKRFLPINSIGWIVGHLAWHEQYYWLHRAQDQVLIPELIEQVGFKKPASTPALSTMILYWEKVTNTSDVYINNLKVKNLIDHMVYKGKELQFNIGTMISRMIYHYWYHNGEMQAIRQLLGHKNLTSFISDDIETVGSFYLDK